LKVPPGQKVAIVGKMGSGKSTIVRLAAGLIHPTDGAILLDGVDIRQISRADVVRNVGVMLQESWLFSGSVRENIQMGYNDYNDEHLLKIAKLSGVDDFIGKHPEGYDLNLKEHGGGLSGGQKQSINLARALIHSPSLLILDEPTSSMDSSTEAAIINNLKESLASQTMIIVTHRNSILALVDRVIVVDGGRVVLDKTPDELKKVQGAM
jgi:ATP-binding cassette subfamily C protein LapB